MRIATAVPEPRAVLGGIAALAFLFSAFVGCGGTSSSDRNAVAGSPAAGVSGAGEAGGTRGGTSGDTGGSRTDPGGAGGVELGGGAGVDGSGTGGAATGGAATGGAATGGSTSSGGIAGSDGTAGAGGAEDDSCTNVSGGGDEPWFDLIVVGTRFDADEGKRMRFVVGTQAGNRLGIAELPIVGGAFALTIPEVLNSGWYVGVTLYVDRNDNDACETEEHTWNFTTRSVLGDMRFDVTPDELCDDTLMTCRAAQPATEVCRIGSGDTDLTAPLPCVP
jgi:hypothetical protein